MNLTERFQTMRTDHVPGPTVEIFNDNDELRTVVLCAMCSDSEHVGMVWPCDTIKALDALDMAMTALEQVAEIGGDGVASQEARVAQNALAAIRATEATG